MCPHHIDVVFVIQTKLDIARLLDSIREQYCVWSLNQDERPTSHSINTRVHQDFVCAE